MFVDIGFIYYIEPWLLKWLNFALLLLLWLLLIWLLLLLLRLPLLLKCYLLKFDPNDDFLTNNLDLTVGLSSYCFYLFSVYNLYYL